MKGEKKKYVKAHTTFKNVYEEYREDLRKDMLNVYDCLKGNVNRMCVTKDAYEFENMYRWARNRLDTIYNLKKNIMEMENDYE